MSLESQIAALVQSTSNLTQEVANKQAQVDARVTAKIAELESWRSSARAEHPVINVFANNLLWSGVAAGVENGSEGLRGTVPNGFYDWIGNAEGVILGTRPFVGNENGMTLPGYCPTPTVLRMKFIPKPGTKPDANTGKPYVPLPFAWGFPVPVAGRHATFAVYARLVSGAQSGLVSDGQVIDAKWRRLIGRQDGNNPGRAYWVPVLYDFTGPVEVELMLPHVFPGWIPDESLPVYAKAVQIL
jgi:hypothetical protein